MTDIASEQTDLVLIAYDGSDLAKDAVAEAGRQLGPGREAVVLTVWQPSDVGFVTPRALSLDAREAQDVKAAAEQVATDGASLADAAGFRARSMATEAAPSWNGIVKVADAQDASLIVLGHHSRTGLTSVLIGSVAAAVANHSQRTVLIIHRRD
jgi:nucleotide-binding universal stress UspA family protein